MNAQKVHVVGKPSIAERGVRSYGGSPLAHQVGIIDSVPTPIVVSKIPIEAKRKAPAFPESVDVSDEVVMPNDTLWLDL